MLTENMKAITDQNNLQESFNEVINQAEARGHREDIRTNTGYTHYLPIPKLEV